MALKAEEVYAILKKQIQSGGGTPGPAGVGIQKIEKTGTDGLVDTYTITYTNGQTTTYTVTNGADGPKGDKGDKGDTGQKGDPGTTPEIGENGNWYLGEIDTGKPSRGEQGPKGEQGETGEQGPPGQTGPTGPIGATPNIQIGTVQTLDPGQDATASMTGTPENPLLNLGIPKGGGSVDPEQIKQAVNEYLDENPPSGGSGITVALKNALLNLASVVVYKDETSGASAYSALESALSQEVSNITLLKISVVCSVSEVAEKTTADELRKYLTVTAIYSDKSSEVVNDYDLEGTVVIGENRFTVTYNEKSATFMITGVKSDSSDSFVKDITKVADVSMNASTGSDRVYAIYNVKAGDTIEYWASWSPSDYSPPKYYDHNPIVEGVDYTQAQTAYNGNTSLPVDSSEYTHTVLVEYSYGKVTFNPVQDYACVVIRTNPTASTFSEVGATWRRN